MFKIALLNFIFMLGSPTTVKAIPWQETMMVLIFSTWSISFLEKRYRNKVALKTSFYALKILGKSYHYFQTLREVTIRKARTCSMKSENFFFFSLSILACCIILSCYAKSLLENVLSFVSMYIYSLIQIHFMKNYQQIDSVDTFLGSTFFTVHQLVK